MLLSFLGCVRSKKNEFAKARKMCTRVSAMQTLVQKVWAMYTSGKVCNFMVLGGIGWNLLVLDGNQLIGRMGLDWVVGGIEHLLVL